MILSWFEIQSRALKFTKKWIDAMDEFAEAQSFLNGFFNVFGVDRNRVATFETKVPLGNIRLVKILCFYMLVIKRKFCFNILKSGIKKYIGGYYDSCFEYCK